MPSPSHLAASLRELAARLQRGKLSHARYEAARKALWREVERQGWTAEVDELLQGREAA